MLKIVCVGKIKEKFLTDAFSEYEKRIIDICREHNNLIMKAPSSWFISDRNALEWVVISSKESKNIMITREDERSIDSMRK